MDTQRAVVVRRTSRTSWHRHAFERLNRRKNPKAEHVERSESFIRPYLGAFHVLVRDRSAWYAKAHTPSANPGQDMHVWHAVTPRLQGSPPRASNFILWSSLLDREESRDNHGVSNWSFNVPTGRAGGGGVLLI